MRGIRSVNGILRLLCGVIDYIVILLPVHIISVSFFKVPQSQLDVLFKFLYAIYGVILIENMNGTTIGKWFGKVRVICKDGTKPTLIESGMRELTKSIYLIPYIGWSLGIINILIILCGGKSLHDFISNTRVVSIGEEVRKIEL